MQEGTAALGGYGEIFRETVALTGVVPQIDRFRRVGGRRCYSPALTDYRDDRGRRDVPHRPGCRSRGARGGDRCRRPGGPKVDERNGVCHLVEHDEASAAKRCARSSLPAVSAGDPLPESMGAAADRRPGSVVPTEPRRAYDVREALAGIVDAGSMLELCPRWARTS